ncbi:MAG: hypothetical protein IT257_05555 [Chitinophagaceae bacterium]|nr:hypothetical protein [Chitinophagaceae bacterium]
MSQSLNTGHGINIRNFKKAILLSENFGQVYAPCNEHIKIPYMLQHWKYLMKVNEEYNIKFHHTRAKIKERETIFRELNKKVTKVCAIAGSLNETAEFKYEVKKLADLIRGFKNKKNGQTAGDERDWAYNLSYTGRTENFKNLIHLLYSSALYKPNERLFTLQNLYAEHASMNTLNLEIDRLTVDVQRCRTIRNSALYDAETGVLETMKACRCYIKALFGTGSEEYKKFSALKFRVLPKKYQEV